jgi:KDO2-lipid IV(A) lauroyltransferase
MFMMNSNQNQQDKSLIFNGTNSSSKNFTVHIPRSYIVKLGKLLGICLYFFDVPHRRLVRRNLRFCFPEWSRARIKNLSQRIFKNAGITVLEIIQSAFISQKDLLEMFRFASGEEHLINSIKNDHKGVVFISCHMGSWETGLQFLGCYSGKPLSVVVRKVGYKWLDNFLQHIRTRFGNKVFFKKEAWQKMVQTLRNGEALMVTIDQSRYKQAVEVMLFNRKATATPAIVMAAIRCRCPVLPLFCVRGSDGTQTIHVHPPIEIQRTNDLRNDLQVNTQKLVAVMEEMIRRFPDQWIWFQRPWKKYYPNLYPEWEAKRQKRKRKKKLRNSKMAVSS